MQQSDCYQSVENAFQEGRIAHTDTATLTEYLNALSNQPIPNEYVRHRDIVRGLTINHILLQRHIAELDRKNGTTQKLVIALTLMSLFASGAQIWYAIRADDREEQEQHLKAQVTTSKTTVALPQVQTQTAANSASSPVPESKNLPTSAK